MDFDPDGIAIMSTYKHGSLNLSHENANLNPPSIQWLGVRSRDLFLDPRGVGDMGILPLSSRDRKMATRMLEKSTLRERGGESEWRQELQVMLMLGVKAEMEMLDSREGGIGSWLDIRLMETMAIP